MLTPTAPNDAHLPHDYIAETGLILAQIRRSVNRLAATVAAWFDVFRVGSDLNDGPTSCL